MNLRRVKAMAKKEIIQVWRDPRSLMIVLLMPLMQVALLGYGVNLDIMHGRREALQIDSLEYKTIKRYTCRGTVTRSVALLGSKRNMAYDNLVCAPSVPPCGPPARLLLIPLHLLSRFSHCLALYSLHTQLYTRFTLSYRDVEDLLAERGLDVSYEMAVKIAGAQFWLWHAVDDEGEVLDLLLLRRRNKAAAVKPMRKLLKKQGFTTRGAGDRQTALLRRASPKSDCRPHEQGLQPG